jgi:hypothetical protein
LQAGYNLRRDREERQRLREELKNRLAIEAKVRDTFESLKRTRGPISRFKVRNQTDIVAQVG